MSAQEQPFVVMHEDPIQRVELAMEELRQGRMIILVDDEDRENEGDLIVAAEHITPEHINFMATHARGLICLSITRAQVDRLGLPMMATNNKSAYETAFTVSIEAREGVTTGISAADRAHTVKVAIRPDATSRDVVVPGHMFPLRARDGGVLERVGQTEGSVDLSRLAGLDPSAVICEIMNPDGTMSRLPELLAFGEEHRMRLCTVADIIKYRMRTERIVERVTNGTMEIDGLGVWNTQLYRGVTSQELHMVLYRGELDEASTLVRVQPSPPPWGTFNPNGSYTSQMARAALSKIAEDGKGALILLHLAGGSMAAIERSFERDVRGNAKPLVQVQAAALRDLGTGCQIIRDLGLAELKLMSNNDRKIRGIDAYGLKIVERVPLSPKKDA